ncbi:TPA: hypothetical protein N0F65_009207 [Lagenidium giganteum]|uniref:Uncharacterized protein n=1 Tax=Lagenidium giganteum TaxID=4803 RepID=A0AAV2YQT4_9STRA|nr:TPA: hypothetical protein N0F65_009207 [Lagenidium giganteum]
MEQPQCRRSHCDAFREAKKSRSAKAISDTSTSAPADEVGDVIGIDIKTCVKPNDIHGNRHSLQIVDHATRYGEDKVIRSHNEFATTEMENRCAERGIRQQLSEAAESSSDGKLEREHRTMFDGMGRIDVRRAPAPSNAVIRGTRAPRVVAESGKKPDPYNVPKWGQNVSVHIKARTMGTRKEAECGFFLGFDDKTKGYRVFVK